ncbi:MAG: flippase-like domain-containing protein [Gemmatimonadales bacterium]|nr:MAG: flippase-like domain-containing protein [Gemmatimonadales bacterium]
MRFLIRALVSLSLLAAVGFLLDGGEIVGRLRAMHPGWVTAALALSVLQVVASAWRWRYTVGRLGGNLSLSRAVPEYYLAAFLNQLLPGGVLGDVARAWRHARDAASEGDRDHGGRAVSAVILERVSGQVVMAGVAGVSVLLLLRASGTGASVWVGLAVVATSLLAAGPLWRRLRAVPLLARVADDLRRGLVDGGALAVQLCTSLFVVGSYLAIYLLSAAAIGVDTPWHVLAPLVAPVLLTMLLPVSVAGWGVREAAAALLWGAVGLAPAEGVAISVAYGVLVLLASLPGGAVLALTLRTRRGRSRRGDPSPDGSDVPAGASPHPASRWEGAEFPAGRSPG